MLFIRSARFAIVDGKGSKYAAVLRGDRSRPTGAQPMRKRQMAVLCPQRVGRNIADDDRLAPVGSRAARARAGADLNAVDTLAVFLWQRRAGAVAQRLAVSIKQENRAQQSAVMLLDVRTQRLQDFR